MHVGIHYSPTERAMNIGDLATAVEEQGFESLFVSEHTHIPVRTPRSLRQRGPIPRSHAEGLDPWISLTLAAARTRRIRLGTAVCLVTQHDPIVLAKQIATLDVLSNGRVDFGIGVGSVVDETANHGVEPEDRWRVLRERILAMKAIWTQDEAEFHGKFVNFDPIYSWPKPAQKPHPAVIVGGNGSHVLNRVVAYGDGWMPTAGTAERSGSTLFERVRELQHLAEDKGRNAIPVGISDAEDDAATLETYQKAGVERVLLRVPAEAPAEVLPLLKRYSALVKQFAAI